MAHISVVIPVYKAEGCLPELYRRLKASLEQLTPEFELILVEDCGGDQSWEIICRIAATDRRVKGIKLSRNFGQHYAISAGLDHSNGDWVVVMDCDLQDQPEEIARLYYKAQEGYDIVFARRHSRRDSLIKKLQSRLFGMLFNYLGDIKLDTTASTFSISSRNVVRSVVRFGERNRSYPIFLNWLGFNRAYVDVEHAARHSGKSSYTLEKLVDLAVDSIVSQSNKPLRLSIRLGLAWSLVSFAYGTMLIVRYLLFSIPVAGWTSLIVSIHFLGGLLFANLGILGLYLGKVFDEVKNRPLYIVDQTRNVAEDPEDQRQGLIGGSHADQRA